MYAGRLPLKRIPWLLAVFGVFLLGVGVFLYVTRTDVGEMGEFDAWSTLRALHELRAATDDAAAGDPQLLEGLARSDRPVRSLGQEECLAHRGEMECQRVVRDRRRGGVHTNWQVVDTGSAAVDFSVESPGGAVKVRGADAVVLMARTETRFPTATCRVREACLRNDDRAVVVGCLADTQNPRRIEPCGSGRVLIGKDREEMLEMLRRRALWLMAPFLLVPVIAFLAAGFLLSRSPPVPGGGHS